jgi:hypothetical protein
MALLRYGGFATEALRAKRQYFYFCTSKASKLSTCAEADAVGASWKA